MKTRAGLDALSGGKAWGLFAKDAMMPDIDRQFRCAEEVSSQACNEPTLAEMTRKAIELLSQNGNGFFLMVEGSQVDWAHHANDPAYALHDFLAFDDAVRVALDFAKANPDTLILAAPDHATGGLSLGNRSTNSSYVAVSVDRLVKPLRGMQTTADFIAKKLGPTPDAAAVKDAVLRYWGIDLTEDDVAEIMSYAGQGYEPPDNMEPIGYGYALGKVVSERYTVLGWTSHGHTGEDVPFWSYGASAPVGHIDNTDFAWTVAEAFALDLNLSAPTGLNQALFVDLGATFSNTMPVGDAANPVLMIVRNPGQQFDLPANKDYLIWRAGKSPAKYCKLDGVIVYAPKADGGKGRWFAPQTAIDVIRTPRLCKP